MMKRTTGSFLLLLAIISGVPVLAEPGPAAGQRASAAARGRLSLSGAWALYPLAIRWQEEFEKSHPGVNIDVQAGGAGKGIADALAGVVDIGMVSREIQPAEVEKGAVALAVAKDAVVATISLKTRSEPEILRRGLKKRRLRSIWIRRTATTWDELTGKAGKTPPYLHPPDACGAVRLGGLPAGIRDRRHRRLWRPRWPRPSGAIRRRLQQRQFRLRRETLKLRTGLEIRPIDSTATAS
jgi:ABC-type phosphate transport system substrate-binding protein